ncbi:MAG: maleylacetoacetate isomerase [Arenimonas sp.]|nr:maleylacetoacetate isomerase [Arenimonas sp.]
MSDSSLTLFHYWRSSASYRARIALNLKGLDYQIQPVNLLEQGGQQHQDDYRQLNPQALVPTLVHNGHAIGQSLAIIEYLDEVFPNNFLLPAEPLARAHIRGIALYIASEGQPLMNLRVLQYLEAQHGFDDQHKANWVRHWLAINFANIEQQLANSYTTSDFVHGHQPGMAECCLVPHAFAAQRFKLNMDAYPTVNRIVSQCLVLPAFIKAHPARQIDTPDEFRAD